MSITWFAFDALNLLVGHQEEHVKYCCSSPRESFLKTRDTNSDKP